MICDGVHIRPSAVRVVFSLFGKERMIMISDSMMATGMEDGNYSLGGLPVTVRGNLATLKDGTIAGSATNLMDCVRTVVKKMEIPLETAVRCATYNPAKVIGVDDVCGSIEAGKYGDCVILSKDDLATQKGIVFVAAAGNSGDRGVAYPAAYEDVLAAGAVNVQAEKTADSAVGENVDLVAPVDTKNARGYFLGELMTCARKANYGYTEE